MATRYYVSLSGELLEAAELLRARRKYRSASEYMAALIRYDALTQQDHLFSGEWAALAPAERDKLDANLLAQVKAAKSARGSLLRKLIYEAIKAMNGPDAKTPTIEEVIKKMAERMATRADFVPKPTTRIK